MSFDRPARNALSRMVGQGRERLRIDVMDQLRRLGFQADGTVLDLGQIAGLSEAERVAGSELRALLDHFIALESGSEGGCRQSAYDRLVREIGFTTFNRLVALRMAEERGLVVQSVGRGLASDGFQVFERVANGALGTRVETYRAYVECLYDELALDLPLLFDRSTPESQIFPGERCLEDVLGVLNDPSLVHLWQEDEAIGWVYQYYNDPEERRRMREASQAPRNSRELAVRNQFFTPRYVVEFLTDNTLGRLWYEMRLGDTHLKTVCRYLAIRPNEIYLRPGEEPPAEEPLAEEMSQEELRRQPVYVPHRAKQDPRDLKVLDPACGSGHFLLYAFDLLETIYAEAWADPESPPSKATGRTLREDYPNQDDLRRQAPRLILRYNLYGVDIDARACQIAALALWLRSQRTYQGLGLRPHERPPLTRGNIVVAESMPGERDLLDQFVARLDPPLVGGLVKLVFGRMRSIGEAGLLLNIEEELRDAIRAAKELWQRAPRAQQLALMPEFERRGAEQLPLFDLSGITEDAFWEQIEQHVFEALETYAAEATNGSATRRRLFAEDAVQGFAFLDLLRKRFDVVLMNPPFGDASAGSLAFLDDQLAAAGRDIGSAFVAAAGHRWAPSGLVGTLLSTAPWFKPSFTQWRLTALTGACRRMIAGAQLGGDVLDGATVSASATVTAPVGPKLAAIFRVFRSGDKQAALEKALLSLRLGSPCSSCYLFDVDQITKIVGAPLAYWISRRFRDQIASLSALQGSGATVRQGTATANEFRFSRAWWEVRSLDAGWLPYTKTSEYSPFWDDPTWVLNFRRNGEEIRSTGKARVQGTDYFGKPGVTYPSKSVLGFNARVHPAGGGFGHTGSVAFPTKHSPSVLLAYLSSSPVEYVLSLFIGSLQGEAGFHPNHYEVGVIQRLPWPDISDDDAKLLAAAAGQAVSSVRRLFQTDETAHDFVAPNGMRFDSVSAAAAERASSERSAITGVVQARQDIDKVVGRLLGLSASDTEEMKRDFQARVPPADGPWRVYFGAYDGQADLRGVAGAFVSYGVGAALGRWDVRFALDPSLAQPIAEPFAPLPSCAPGMLVGPDGLPATPNRIVSQEWLRARPNAITLPPDGSVSRPTIGDEKYPARISWDGILVDDPEHSDDIVRRVEEVLAVLWRDRSEAMEQDACESLDVHSLREYFRRPTGFFADHLKRYSKSRRQAPIYWPLSTSSGSYTIWVYYDRLTSDTLYTVVNRYVEPKIASVERELRATEGKLTTASGRAAAKLREQVEDARTFATALRGFRDELLRVAALPYRPNENDGVSINAAPLHKLFRLPKWSKDLRETWARLEKGDYDWTHLAYAIWPERVREKSRTDRSLAIAHNLEHLYSASPATSRQARHRAPRVEVEGEDEE